jgi:hypothetical protein
MAATKRNAMLIEEARAKIRTTQLINRLQDHGVGKVKMSQSQVRAIEILLKKVIPDLSSVDQTIEGNLGYSSIPVSERDGIPGDSPLDAATGAASPGDPPASRH